MVDETQANNKADTTAQQEPVPSSDQNVAADKQPEKVSPQGEDQQDMSQAELPGEVKDRTTEQFEKLKKQLAEERARRVKAENVFSQIKPDSSKTQQVSATETNFPDYFNPETGEVDVTKLEARNKSLEQRLQQLDGSVKSIREADQRKQEEETFASYPELNPAGDKFDETFHNAVAGYLTNSYLKGENPTFKQAADALNGLRAKDLKKAEKKGATEAIEQLTPKEQASLEATGRSDRRQDVGTPLEDLQYKTRRGDDVAVAERLSKLGGVGR